MNTLHLNQIGDKVIVKKGEGGGGEANNEEYVDVRGLGSSADIFLAIYCSLQMRAVIDNTTVICSGSVSETASSIEYLCMNLTRPFRFRMGGVTYNSYKELMSVITNQLGLEADWYEKLPRITKEEFYTL